jgi:amidohydrolase
VRSEEIQPLKDQVVREVDHLRNHLLAMSKAIHENPETAFQEHRSMAILSKAAEDAGFDVTRGVGGIETAFKATYAGNGDGPIIGLFAEYDALPELGHACGHNIIGASSTGAALAVRSVMDRLPGQIALYGTPAEEGGGGKIIMLKNGAFDGVDIAMLVHPSTRTMTRRSSLAASHIQFEFIGRPAHASSAPEHGINALDACIQTFNSVNALRQQLSSDIRIHGIITRGGDAVNIIPDYAAAEFMVRAPKLVKMQETAEKVIRCAESSAHAMGARIEISRQLDYADMIPNLTLADLYAENITALGEEVVEALPHESRASSDMGNVSHVIPSIQPHIKIADEGVAGHTPEFREAAISTWGNEGLIKVAKALAMTTVDLLGNPEVVSRVKDEFERQARN